jgi:hypothetical protein
MKTILIFIFAFFVLLQKDSAQEAPCLPGSAGICLRLGKLQNYPPYNINMPFDVLVAYVAADSLYYNVNFPEYFYFMKNQTYSDTLKKMMRYF